MNNSAGMRGDQGIGDLNREIEHGGGLQGAAGNAFSLHADFRSWVGTHGSFAPRFGRGSGPTVHSRRVSVVGRDPRFIRVAFRSWVPLFERNSARWVYSPTA